MGPVVCDRRNARNNDGQAGESCALLAKHPTIPDVGQGGRLYAAVPLRMRVFLYAVLLYHSFPHEKQYFDLFTQCCGRFDMAQ